MRPCRRLSSSSTLEMDLSYPWLWLFSGLSLFSFSFLLFKHEKCHTKKYTAIQIPACIPLRGDFERGTLVLVLPTVGKVRTII